MNVSEKEIPKYLNFLDSHLKLKILDFYKKETTEYYKAELLKTGLESKQKENKLNEEAINEKKTKLVNSENSIKLEIVGYLNLVSKSNGNIDISSSMNKKIVK
jgi:hypothetical protein